MDSDLIGIDLKIISYDIFHHVNLQCLVGNTLATNTKASELDTWNKFIDQQTEMGVLIPGQ